MILNDEPSYLEICEAIAFQNSDIAELFFFEKNGCDEWSRLLKIVYNFYFMPPQCVRLHGWIPLVKVINTVEGVLGGMRGLDPRLS